MLGSTHREHSVQPLIAYTALHRLYQPESHVTEVFAWWSAKSDTILWLRQAYIL